MGLAAQFAGPISRVLARLHRWYPTAWLLGRVPIAAIDVTSVGRLRYALMMSNLNSPVRAERLLRDVVQRNRGASAELLIELAAMATSTAQPAMAADLLQQALAAAADPFTADAAGRLLKLNRADGDGTLRATMQDRVKKLRLAAPDQLTLVPVSGKYLELWQLWLEQVRIHIGGQVVAMAMDDAAVAALSGEPDVAVLDVREFFSWDAAGRLNPHTRGVLWYLRVLLLRDLVQRGHHVMVLDLDAMPVGNINALLSTLAHVDVVVQRDHSIPMDVERAFGFVLCCGFMLWRPTPSACELLDRFVAQSAIERDDQLALNHLLFQQGILLDKAAGNLQFKSEEAIFACPDATVVSRTVESGSVIRHFHQTGQSIEALRTALQL